ncbi:hypothetical protein [Rahnella aceris]|uniref:hypothetical protein n=1 Tax=Rahnella sp. (strain Y9602) TaxID=2703885 RepID=UPI003B9F93BD
MKTSGDEISPPYLQMLTSIVRLHDGGITAKIANIQQYLHHYSNEVILMESLNQLAVNSTRIVQGVNYYSGRFLPAIMSDICVIPVLTINYLYSEAKKIHNGAQVKVYAIGHGGEKNSLGCITVMRINK